ncbi:MAG: hypothetical protein KGY66_04720 [Candidatus Thermoplasmatota archaeon]|nr:hypothetical protein [Candidatus Thermoplasmatota archaeon]MBS3790200.1 hypothetical protein [Candidatus Thermoplasmatota archaeon]
MFVADDLAAILLIIGIVVLVMTGLFMFGLVGLGAIMVVGLVAILASAIGVIDGGLDYLMEQLGLELAAGAIHMLSIVGL